jgi:hypothetical protein
VAYPEILATQEAKVSPGHISSRPHIETAIRRKELA